jgi:hypothetical protein
MQVVHGYCQRSRTALAGVQAATSCIMPPYFKEAQSEDDLAQSHKGFLWGLLVRGMIAKAAAIPSFWSSGTDSSKPLRLS